VRAERERSHLCFRDLDAETRGRAGVPDQVDDSLENPQWFAAPVLGDVTEKEALLTFEWVREARLAA